MVARPEDYFFAPDGEDLVTVYGEIARAVVPCPREQFWPLRRRWLDSPVATDVDVPYVSQ
jgi:hypothetical protein